MDYCQWGVKMDTKRALIQTMSSLLEKDTIDKITVRSISEASGISKATFYKYFLDKFDLMMSLYKSFYYDHIDTNQVLHKKTGIALLAFIRNNRKYFINAFKSQGQNSCYEAMRRMLITNCTRLYMANKGGACLTNEEEALIEFNTAGIMALTLRWINSGLKEGPEEIAENIYQCISEKLKIALID
jgi:AcrR family transcriptional regulator